MRKLFNLLAKLLFTLVVSFSSLMSPQIGEAATSDDEDIRSQAELDEYLRRNEGMATPFDALPPGARERFFGGLSWGRTGLGGFNGTPLSDELSQPQIEAILRLFGEELLQYAPQSHHPETYSPPPEAWVISDLEKSYNEFYPLLSRELDDQHLSGLLIEQFDVLLGPSYSFETLRELDERHLSMLWNAATLVAMQSNSPRYVAAMENVLSEISRRSNGRAEAEKIIAIRNAMLASRRFADAAALLESHPLVDLPPLPEFTDQSDTGQRNTAWQMSDDGRKLSRMPVSLLGTRILITAGCHFSVDAAQDISEDPILGPVFAKHASWLMLPPGIEDVDAVHAWNSRFPNAPALMIYSRDEWPIFERWMMPRFHIVREGEVIAVMEGWDRDNASYRENLINLLSEAGLL